jgi:glycosyltransferase involved in cell wall biosynthesis
MPGPVPLTVVIPTLDEAAQIGPLVAGLSWAGEVIVADGGSADGTVALARAAGATVLEATGPTIAAQRNAAIARASHPWVFALDADERVSPELAEELGRVLAAPAHPAYRVRRRNFYLGHELRRGHWGRDWVTRLFPRERRFVERRVHEHLEPVSHPGLLTGTLLHTPYRDLSHQLEKMERYARWGAQDLFDKGERASFWDLAGHPLGRFLRAYLLQGNLLDGRFGLATSMLGAYGNFLKYAHLWALEREGR